MRHVILFALGLLAAFPAPGSQPVAMPSKKDVHIYLLMGQSNMAGRGEISPEDIQPHPRVVVFTQSNTWEHAVEPITRDRAKGLGVGPGLAFGKLMAERHPNATVALLPCAVGGTPLTRWSQGGDLYSNAVHRARLATRDGTLKGVLWHQGENDSIQEDTSTTYGERLGKMIADLRRDLGAPRLPFVAGEIGHFLYTRSDPTKTPFAREINGALSVLPRKVRATACVSAAGLIHKGDEVHFDAASQRELGRRYAAEMIRLQSGAWPFPGRRATAQTQNRR